MLKSRFINHYANIASVVLNQFSHLYTKFQSRYLSSFHGELSCLL